jgi:predicted dehydrogenase
MLSVALLSKWHVHARDYAREARAHPEIEIRLVWDEVPERGRAWAEELGVAFEPRLERVLADPGIDGVIIASPTHMHKEIMLQAAAHGKHIFSEKVLAFTTEDCEEIFRVADERHIHIMLALKRLCDPYYLYAQHALDRGLLGKLNLIRCRLAHGGGIPREDRPYGELPPHFYDPEQAGGGALIDLGAHPIYLVNRLAGPAAGLYARLNRSIRTEVDDNSAVLLDYASGALGIIEAGFVSHNAFLLELHGTEGILLIEKGGIRIRSRHLNGDEWVVPDELPEPLPSPMAQWVNWILRGDSPSITREDMWRLTQINQAAIRSQLEGRRVQL